MSGQVQLKRKLSGDSGLRNPGRCVLAILGGFLTFDTYVGSSYHARLTLSYRIYLFDWRLTQQKQQEGCLYKRHTTILYQKHVNMIEYVFPQRANNTSTSTRATSVLKTVGCFAQVPHVTLHGGPFTRQTVLRCRAAVRPCSPDGGREHR